MRRIAACSSSLSFPISFLDLCSSTSLPNDINRIFNISLTSLLQFAPPPPPPLFFFFTVSNPSLSLLFLLYLIPHALHSDWRFNRRKLNNRSEIETDRICRSRLKRNEIGHLRSVRAAAPQRSFGGATIGAAFR